MHQNKKENRCFSVYVYFQFQYLSCNTIKITNFRERKGSEMFGIQIYKTISLLSLVKMLNLSNVS